MGIYYVFFKAVGGHELKLDITVKGREAAIAKAEKIVEKMGSLPQWKYSHCEGCR